ncbi:MAG: hypothetical protein ABEK84_09740 [Salinibacter sp.]
MGPLTAVFEASTSLVHFPIDRSGRLGNEVFGTGVHTGASSGLGEAATRHFAGFVEAELPHMISEEDGRRKILHVRRREAEGGASACSGEICET